jgi:hypothetical protein
MIGYCAEIVAEQKAHLPRKKSQEKRGMLCQGLRFVPHAMQCEAGKATLSSFGIRKMTTFKNEPKSVPNIKARKVSTILIPQNVVELL